MTSFGEALSGTKIQASEPHFSLDAVRCRLGTSMIPNEEGWTVTIERGSRLAVLGRSGSGKTTFLHVLGLLSPLSFGKVCFHPTGDQAVDYGELYLAHHTDLRQTRSQRFGFVFQADHLLDTLNTEHNLSLPLLLRGMARDNALERAREWAARFFEAGELDGILCRNPSDLSGGQRSRIALLRGLISDPEVLFLDEPFTYLDNVQITRAIGWLRHWQGNGGARTIVIVTHHLDQAVELATHFLVLAPDRRVLFRAAAELGEPKRRLAWLQEILPDEREASND